jgi:Flp pilus assembly protein TadG
VDTRNPSKDRVKKERGRTPKRGSISIQMLVILVPVLFGFMGFALDLGRLYLIRAELNQAASAMALTAAARLIGTGSSTGEAITAVYATNNSDFGHANSYNFGANVIGQTSGLLSSAASPAFYSTVSAARQDSAFSGGDAEGAMARHVRIVVTADAPLLFWSFLSVGRQQKTRVDAMAIAGMSAPLCTACGIEPFAIEAADPGDPMDFGFVRGTKYMFFYDCTGRPQMFPGITNLVRFLPLSRLDNSGTLDANQQMYKIGAQGLPSSMRESIFCLKISSPEQPELILEIAQPQSCLNPMQQNWLNGLVCGLNTRFEPNLADNCALYDGLSNDPPDSDVTDLDDYAGYAGNTRRVITVPVVAQMNRSGVIILGFRQFLLEPTPNRALPSIDTRDGVGRFLALYIGSVVPLKQGSFGGCNIEAGPGKVVLHQ